MQHGRYERDASVVVPDLAHGYVATAVAVILACSSGDEQDQLLDEPADHVHDRVMVD
jgi:hypothetical protein